MSRTIAITTLIVVFVLGAVLWINAHENANDEEPVAQQSAQSRDGISDEISINEPVELAATNTDDAADSTEAVSCDLRQIETLQQFNRDNLERLESSILSPEAVAAYRGLSLNELKALAEQDDSLAMMMHGLQWLFISMGRNSDIAVDYFYYQMPIAEITPHPNGVPDNAFVYAVMARNMFLEAAMRGRHAAFTFIGLTYRAQGKTAVDLEWISQEAYDALDDDQKNSLEPHVAYSQLAYVIDPNLLPAGSPNRRLFDRKRAELGEHAEFLNKLESDFRQLLERSGRIFPVVAPLNYPDVDEDVIAACEEAGYSQWPD